MSRYQEFYDFCRNKSIHRFLKRGAELYSKIKPWQGSEWMLHSERNQWKQAELSFWGEYRRLEDKPADMPQFNDAEDFVRFVIVGSEDVVIGE